MSSLKLLDKTVAMCYILNEIRNVQSGEKMGVIYKVKTEIKNFILEQKKKQPVLSCRGLAALVQEKFQIKVSKSSINSLIKEAGLSMPVGRRRKKRRKLLEVLPKIQEEIKLLTQAISKTEEPVSKTEEPVTEEPVEVKSEEPKEIECSGAILLKAAAYLIGGTYYINGVIKRGLTQQGEDSLAKIESLLWSLLDKKLSQEGILSYLTELQSAMAIKLDTFQILSTIMQEVRGIKATLLDGGIFYLDGQLHTVWSTPQIPYDFNTTMYNIKSYINKYFYKDTPFLLGMAPGYDTPTPEFFNFILSFEAKEKIISKLTLYGNKFEGLEEIPFSQSKRRFFIFGLWPWQFVDYRKVKKLGEFRPFYFEALKKNFFIADIELELSQPNTNQLVTLKGFAIKTSLTEKTRLIILSNLTQQELMPERWLTTYLNHWPNLEETFKDFSRKLELFTYTASSQVAISIKSLNLNKEAPSDIKTLLDNYLEALDLYARWHFFPFEYENQDFSTMKERFYNLKGILKKEKDYILVTFLLPANYPYLAHLQYALRRMNEREIIFGDSKRLWLDIASAFLS
jgi:hypothetical protein